MVNPVVELLAFAGVLNGVPRRRLVRRGTWHALEDLLGGAGSTRLRQANGGPANAIGVAIEREVELDVEPFAVVVNQLDNLLTAAAVMAEQGEGHGVED